MLPPQLRSAHFLLHVLSPSVRGQPHTVLRDVGREADRRDCRFDPSYNVSFLAAGDIRCCPRHRPADRLAISFYCPPWPPNAIWMSRAAPDFTTLAVSQAVAAPSAAQCLLNSPGLKEELRPVLAKLRASGIVGRYSQQK